MAKAPRPRFSVELRRIVLIVVGVLAILVLAAIAVVWNATRPRSIDAFCSELLPDDRRELSAGQIRVTYLGTTSLLFDDGETQLLIDAFLSRPAVWRLLGKIGTDESRVNRALDRARADRVRAVFVAHSHYDHALDVGYIGKVTGAKIYGSQSTLNVALGAGLKPKQIEEFEPGRRYSVGQFTVEVLAARHSPPIQGLNDDEGEVIHAPLEQPARFCEFKEGGAFDFLVRWSDQTVLVNTAANYLTASREGLSANVVFLSTGQLSSQCVAFQEAFYAETVGRVKPKLVIPLHWDSFFYPLDEPLGALGDPAFEFLRTRTTLDGVDFGILQGFASIVLPVPE
jgi:L-ascorbate metabolism protein UlaG (beta-lactamase superfamily)